MTIDIRDDLLTCLEKGEIKYNSRRNYVSISKVSKNNVAAQRVRQTQDSTKNHQTVLS